MAIPQSSIEEIKYKCPIEDVVSSYITLKRRGKNLIGLCPFHGEKTASFTIYPENGSFYCFGCKVGGDAFTFIKLIENLDYIDAVKLLAERCGVVVAETDKEDTLHKLRNTIYEINRETARFYYSNLFTSEGKWGLDYYLSRGLTESTIKTFGLGVAFAGWDTLVKHLRSKGFSFEDMVLADVAVKSSKGTYFDRFRDRTIFPIINVRGNVIAFSGRRRTEDKTLAKYVNTKDTLVYNKGQNLFGINIAKSHCAEQMILVEGNFDAVALHQAGFKNVVAPFGTALTTEQSNMLSRYTKEVVLCFDADPAGAAAVEKSFKTLAPTRLPVKVLRLPVGKDPDEFLKSNKPSDFQKLIDTALPETQYKLLKAADNIDPSSAEAKIKYLNNAVEILASNDDPIAVDLYLNRLSKEYDVSKETLVAKITQIKKGRAVAEKKREVKKVVEQRIDRNDINPERRGNERAVSAEEMIISILMKHPDLYEYTLSVLTADDFVSALNKQVFTSVCEQLSHNQSFSISGVADRFSSMEIGYISKLLNTGFEGDNPKLILSDCISVLKTEKTLAHSADDIDDWASQMQAIAQNKKG